MPTEKNWNEIEKYPNMDSRDIDELLHDGFFQYSIYERLVTIFRIGLLLLFWSYILSKFLLPFIYTVIILAGLLTYALIDIASAAMKIRHAKFVSKVHRD